MELNPDFAGCIQWVNKRRKTDMKKLIFMACLLCVSGVELSFARPADKPCERLEKSYAWMKDSLNLNASQQQQIGRFRDEACAALKTAKTEAGEDRELLKTKAKDILQNYRKQVRSVLSSEQISKLEARQKAAGKGKGKSHGTPEQRAARMTAVMKEKLLLTAVQEKTVADANLALVKKTAALKEQLKSGGDTAAVRAALKKARQEHDATVRSVLTPDQMKSWDALKADMHEKMRHRRAGK